MGLEPGDRLSIYEVVAPLGAGAMGEVYRAHDTRLEREVAIKLLPEDLAADPERLARFEREAKLLASLNHPNIGAIYGVEDFDGKRFLVLELIEGQTLGDRIAAGPIPVDEVVALSWQIAEGLEAAHECGVVHRDLKPDNIRTTPDDTVKLLDFGLAKAVAGPGSGTSPESVEMTQTGMLLGTPYYMSPEQIRGRPVDRRADIWAFGCVLYEALTGARAFPGETMAEVAAGVLDKDVDLDALPPATPPHVRALIADCLVKDAKDRLRDIGDARRALAAPRDSEAPAAAVPAPRNRWALPLAVVLAVLVVAAALALWPVDAKHQIVPERILKFAYDVPSGVRVWASSLRISPDGAMIALIGAVKDETFVYVRRLDASNESPWKKLDDTRGAQCTRFSPDSELLAVGCWLPGAETHTIRTVNVVDDTKPSEKLWEGSGSTVELDWSEQGDLWVLLLSSRLLRLGRDGEVRSDVKLPTDVVHNWRDMQVARDQDLVFVSGATTGPDGVDEYLSYAIPLGGGESALAILELGSAMWFPAGHLLHAKRGNVMVQRFDPERRTLQGRPVPLLGNLWRNRAISHGEFDLTARADILVYFRASDPAQAGARLIAVDGRGEVTEILEPGPYTGKIAVSRDGKIIVAGVDHKGRWEPRVSVDGKPAQALAWLRGMNSTFCLSPDAKTLYGQDLRTGRRGIYRVRIDREAEPEPLVAGAKGVWFHVMHISPDGGSLAYLRVDGTKGPTERNGLDAVRCTVHLLQLANRMSTELPVRGNWIGQIGKFSPDGRKLGYTTDKDGQNEVYTISTAGGTPTRVTKAGGIFIAWSADGQTTYFESPDRWLCETTGGKETRLFDLMRDDVRGFDTSVVPLPDGRFLMVQVSETEFHGPRKVHVISGFPRLVEEALAAE